MSNWISRQKPCTDRRPIKSKNQTVNKNKSEGQAAETGKTAERGISTAAESTSVWSGNRVITNELMHGKDSNKE